MGVELRATTFKLSDSTLAKLEALQGRFSLVCANRTQVVRLAIDLLELIAFTQGSMEEIVKGLQGLLRIAHFPVQSEFRFPAADSAAQGGAGSDCSGGDLAVRPRVVVSINHRRESRQSAVPTVYVERACSTSFLFKSTPARGLAA